MAFNSIFQPKLSRDSVMWCEITKPLGPEAAPIALPGWAGLEAGSLQRLSFLETVTASTLWQPPGEGSRCNTELLCFSPRRFPSA